MRNAAVLGALYAGLAGALGFRLGQDLNWDLLNYHFYNSHMLFTGRFDRDVHAAGIQTFLNPLLDVPLYLAVQAGVPPPVFFLALSAVHGVVLLLVHRITVSLLPRASRVVAEASGVMAALTAAFGAGFGSEIGSSMADDTLAVFVLAALWLALRGAGGRVVDDWRSTALAGLLAGVAVGAKLTNAMFVLGLAVVCLAAPGSGAARARRVSMLAAGAALGTLLTGGYWMWLMFEHFQSPLFPFFNAIFQSPFAPTDENFFDPRALPRTLPQTLFYPFFFVTTQNLVTEPLFRDSRLACAYLAFVGLVAAAAWRWWHGTPWVAHEGERRLWLLTAFFASTYIVWQHQFSIYRYIISLEALTGALIVGSAAYWLRHPKVYLATVVPVSMVLMMTPIGPAWGRTAWSDSYFGVDRRPLERFADATILLWDFPDAYLVPHFPASTVFLRVRSNWGLMEDGLLWTRIRTGIAATRPGALYVMEIPAAGNGAAIDDIVRRLGWAADRSRCTPITSHAGEHQVCPLSRQTPHAAKTFEHPRRVTDPGGS
jgi:hypothetical protein